MQGILGALDWLERNESPVYDIFNLGESQTVTLATLVEVIGRAMGSEPRLDRQPMQPGDVLCTYADISKARQILGYDPQVNIETGIERFVAWLQAQNANKS